jgi:hypothetical protein
MRMRLPRELPTLDEISITVRQRGDECQGVQIPGVDVAGGPGGSSSGLDAGKGKGKASVPIRNYDKVSLDDDHPLESRRRLLDNHGLLVIGPLPPGQ